MTSLRGASGDRRVFPGIPVYGKAPYPRVAAVRGLNRPPVALVAAGRLGVSLCVAMMKYNAIPGE